MTTKVTVSANHGWPVDGKVIPTNGTPDLVPPSPVPAGESWDCYVHSGADLLIHEVQPDVVAPTPAPAMTHQAVPVAGYRQQTGGAVDEVNTNKGIEKRTLRRLDELAADQQLRIDGRWFAIGPDQ